MSNKYPVLIDDVPEEYRDIVELIGMDCFLKLCYLCGGQTLYVPIMDTLQRGPRDRLIRDLFDGHNYKALGRQFRLSERQIRKIINGTRI